MNPQRVQASALFYAVVVVLLVGSVVGGIILLTHHRNQLAERWLVHERVASNARSAAHLALSRSGPEATEEFIDLFGEGTDSAAVRWTSWGGLDLVHARAWYADQQATVAAFAGRHFDDALVLDLARRAGTLHLCGDARLHGDVRVAQADVRRGHIEGRPFSGERLVEGTIHRATETTTTLRSELEERVRRLCAGLAFQAERIVTDAADPGPPWSGDPQEPVPVLHYRGATHLDQIDLRGPLIIRCDDSLSIGVNAALDLVIIQAPFIAVDPGAAFSAQCFATTGIVIGEGAQLHFPSMLAVCRDERRSEAALIDVGEDVAVHGAVILLDRSVRDRSGGGLVIHPRAEVHGEVFVEGGVQHQGLVTGTLVAHEMVLRTPASMYHGHLLDGILRPYTFGEPRGFGCSHQATERTLLQWAPITHGTVIG
jgi:hypothetical protein